MDKVLPTKIVPISMATVRQLMSSLYPTLPQEQQVAITTNWVGWMLHIVLLISNMCECDACCINIHSIAHKYVRTLTHHACLKGGETNCTDPTQYHISLSPFSYSKYLSVRSSLHLWSSTRLTKSLWMSWVGCCAEFVDELDCCASTNVFSTNLVAILTMNLITTGYK